MSYQNTNVQENPNTSESCKTETICSNNQNERVWFHQVVIDIIGNQSKITMLVCIPLSMILLLVWNEVDYCEEQKINLCSDIITICSCILGFVITGYSVILTLNECVVEKLSKKYKQKKECCLFSKTNPYDILCSSFSICSIILVATIIVTLLYKNHPYGNCSMDWVFIVVRFLFVLSVLMIIDIICHLYSISTYLNKKHRKISFKKQ